MTPDESLATRALSRLRAAKEARVPRGGASPHLPDVGRTESFPTSTDAEEDPGALPAVRRTRALASLHAARQGRAAPAVASAPDAEREPAVSAGRKTPASAPVASRTLVSEGALEPGPATLAHGNEPVPADLGPVSFDPSKFTTRAPSHAGSGSLASTRAARDLAGSQDAQIAAPPAQAVVAEAPPPERVVKGEGLDTPEVAAAIRDDIQQAVRRGDLPKATYSVRTGRGGLSIDVVASDLPFVVLNPEAFVVDAGGTEVAFDRAHHTSRFSPAAQEVERTLNAIVDAYHWDRSDPTTDYYNARFAKSVSLTEVKPVWERIRAAKLAMANAAPRGEAAEGADDRPSEEALAKLEAELRNAQQRQERYLAVRAGDRRRLVELGVSEAEIEGVLSPNFAREAGVSLSTLAQRGLDVVRREIHRLESQLQDLVARHRSASEAKRSPMSAAAPASAATRVAGPPPSPAVIPPNKAPEPSPRSHTALGTPSADARPANQNAVPSAPPAFAPGNVVRFRDPMHRRRYVVTRVSSFGNGDFVSAVALSGGPRESAPSSVPARDLVLDADQTVTFSGADAGRLRRRYEQARSSAMRAQALRPAPEPLPPQGAAPIGAPASEARPRSSKPRPQSSSPEVDPHRVVQFTWPTRQYTTPNRNALLAAAGSIPQFSPAPLAHDRLVSAPMLANSHLAQRFREAIHASPAGEGVEENDVTSWFAFGRTRMPVAADREGTLTLSQSGLERVVAVPRENLAWQVTHFPDWRPFDRTHTGTPTAEGFVVGPYLLRPQSDGTWSLRDTSRSWDWISLWRDQDHAVRAVERLRAPAGHALPVVSMGPRPATVRVVGWRDGGPLVTFPLVTPALERRGDERRWLVTAYLPSTARHLTDLRRRAEKVVLTIEDAAAGGAVTPPQSATDVVQRIALAALDELPAEARKRPRERVRASAPFQVADRVRYLGPARPGLDPGAIGIVDHIFRPRDRDEDLSEIVFAPSGHVERAGARDVEGRFVRVVGEEAASVADLATPTDVDHAARAARGRAAASELERRVASAEAEARRSRRSAAAGTSGDPERYVRQAAEMDQLADTLRRRLWVAERIARVSGALAKKEPPPKDEAPEPLPQLPDIEGRRAAYQEKRDRRIEGLRSAGERRLAKAENTYQTARTMADAIPFGQPILVGHHSEKRDRRYRERFHQKFEKSFALQKEGAAFIGRAKAAETNKSVFSDDPDAIEKLRAEIASLQAHQEKFKAINKAVRADDRAKLAELGLSPKQVEDAFKPDVMGRIGIRSYALTNNAANIRRLEARLEELEQRRREGPKSTQTFGGVEVSEEEERVRIRFDRPDRATLEKVKDMLRGAGFKWSPQATAWQRLANARAWYVARDLAPKLNAELVGKDASATTDQSRSLAREIGGGLEGSTAPGASNNGGLNVEDLSSRLQSSFDSLDAEYGGHNQVLLYDLRRKVNVSRDAFDASLDALRRRGVFTLSSDEGRFGKLSAEAVEAGLPGPSGRLVYVARRHVQ